jgi:hypothetical protein
MGFLTEVTAGGYALTFPLSPEADAADASPALAATETATSSAAAAASHPPPRLYQQPGQQQLT